MADLTLFNKKNLDIRKQESFGSLSGTHTPIFCGFQLFPSALRLLWLLNCPFKGLFYLFVTDDDDDIRTKPIAQLCLRLRDKA